jgi:glutathione S-transferase
MKLYLNSASPYARLVLVVAHEKGLADDLELVWTDPWASEEKLVGVTPFSKVPALIAHDGLPLLESSCICDYLDEHGAAPRLMPASGDARLAALRKVGFGRSLMDAAFGTVIQKRFAGNENSLGERWRASIMRAIERLNEDAPRSATPDLGDLVLGVALSYIDFRLADLNWRGRASNLAAWHERLCARPSMIATLPK